MRWLVVSFLSSRNHQILIPLSCLQQPQSTELRPIVRLRHHGLSSPALRTIPLAFSFLSPHSSSLPVKFLPPNNTFSPASVSSSLPSSSPHRRTQSVSPRLPSRPTNYQDILVFDPSDGSLSLRRLLISTKVGEPNSILSALPIPGATSISLPGMGFGRPSPSPPKVGISASKPAALPDNLPYELDARESVIATWSLSRDAKWSDVKVPLLIEHENQRQRLRVPKAEYVNLCCAFGETVNSYSFISSQMASPSRAVDFLTLSTRPSGLYLSFTSVLILCIRRRLSCTYPPLVL